MAQLNSNGLDAHKVLLPQFGVAGRFGGASAPPRKRACSSLPAAAMGRFGGADAPPRKLVCSSLPAAGVNKNLLS